MKNGRVSFVLATLLAVPAIASDFFVAPSGQDSGPGTRTKPFASFNRAQEAVRAERKAHPDQAVTVTFRPGTYWIEAPIEFGPGDSGASPEHPVTYRAQSGETVVVSGGKEISGWQPDVIHPGLWKTRVPPNPGKAARSWRFDQLWVNGVRAVRARTPNYWEFGVLKKVSEAPADGNGPPQRHTFMTDPELLSSLRGLDEADLRNVQIVVFHKWDTTREWLESASPAEGVLTGRGAKQQPWNGMDKDSRFYLENWLGALDSAGEWFLDREGWLYYKPRSGEDMAHAQVVAPFADGLLVFRGQPESSTERVRHLRFKGLNFRHSEFQIPAAGLPPAQAAMNVDACAVRLDGASDITFSQCAVEHIGGSAFWFRQACRDCRVEHTRMFDLGVGGVRIGEMEIVPEARRTGGISISNCIIQSGGRITPEAVGVWIGHSSDNAISHCDIGDFFYTAVSVGWRWGYAESAAKRNTIEYNHLHHLGYRILSDMGAVYSLGPSEGTVVRNNVIHDVYAAQYGGWGLYPDEGSTGILFENNLVYDVKDGCIHQHYGKENTFRNNILAFSEEGQLALTRAEPHLSFTFEHNLVYWEKGSLLGYDGWRKGAKVELKNNLYWRADGKPFDFAGKTWEQWRADGKDQGSIIADPLFVDPLHGNFRLKANSPARQIGFQPFAFEAAGVQGDAGWKKLAASISFPMPYIVPGLKP